LAISGKRKEKEKEKASDCLEASRWILKESDSNETTIEGSAKRTEQIRAEKRREERDDFETID
jgi:hypothetical protein